MDEVDDGYEREDDQTEGPEKSMHQEMEGLEERETLEGTSEDEAEQRRSMIIREDVKFTVRIRLVLTYAVNFAEVHEELFGASLKLGRESGVD